MSDTKKNRLIKFLTLTGYRVLSVNNSNICVIDLVGAPKLFNFKALNKEMKLNKRVKQ